MYLIVPSKMNTEMINQNITKIIYIYGRKNMALKKPKSKNYETRFSSIKTIVILVFYF